MEITNAKKKEDIIHKKVLEEKFQKMLSIQNEKIKERMTEGEKYVVWIFGDEEYYHNPVLFTEQQHQLSKTA